MFQKEIDPFAHACMKHYSSNRIARIYNLRPVHVSKINKIELHVKHLEYPNHFFLIIFPISKQKYICQWS
jgi:hypothetical protein